jgi:ligand-binding SRPBCC domain-containing protein
MPDAIFAALRVSRDCAMGPGSVVAQLAILLKRDGLALNAKNPRRRRGWREPLTQHMPCIRIETVVNAPIERCFDLARDIDLHLRSMVQTGETAVAGTTTGLIGLGEEVTWQAKHFGVRQRLTSKITRFDRPYHFRDSQVRGPFRRFDHDHYFSRIESSTTLIRDEFNYDSPFGWIGVMADYLFLKRYMRRLLERRNAAVKEAAESLV